MSLLRSRLFVKLLKSAKISTSITRWNATAVQKAQDLQPGTKLHGYSVQKVEAIPELSLAAVHLLHERTGAQHLHVARQDSNNVFGVSFRTTPMNDTGVPHILEHTVLCGSEKYPARDPFFKMLNRSLATFMNAFTSSDWTMYPFSTQNATDYNNLMSVYMDAVFFPRLRETDFKQEGWRLENENLRDKNSPIIFKGVVFNEMKGVFSNSQQLYCQKAQNFILPSHTYATCYGGDPAAIPQLTCEQLRNFHATYYHPSNARFYTYGDLPVERHLEQINSVIGKFEKIDPKTEVPLEPRWTSPVEKHITCQPDPMCADPEKQTTMSVIYLLNDVVDSQEAYILSFLSNLLVSGEKSPFYRSLIEPNIGSDFSPVLGNFELTIVASKHTSIQEVEKAPSSFLDVLDELLFPPFTLSNLGVNIITPSYDNSARNARFSVGLQGIKQNDVEQVKQIIAQTIDKVIEEGFEEDQVEAKLHEVELALKHQSTSFGLHLGINIVPSWNHDGDPVEVLQINKYMDYIKASLKTNPRFLQEKVQQYLKDNQHRLTLVMSPSEDFESKRKEQEATQLKEMLSKLTAEDKTKIYEKGIELEAVQNQKEDLSCLPTLRVEDIERKRITTPIDHTISDGVSIQTCVQPTNGVTYFRAVSSLIDLPKELQPYVPLFCEIVTNMGAGDMDYIELAQQASLKTDGLNASPHIAEHHTDNRLFEQSILFSSFCLDRNINSMFGLWKDVFQRLRLDDTQRLTTLVRMTAADLASSITMSGHAYAMRHAASTLSPTGNLRELYSGMTQVQLMKNVAESDDLSDVREKLRAISKHVLKSTRMRCSLNTTNETMDQAVKDIEMFVHDLALPSGASQATHFSDFLQKDASFEPHSCRTHLELPFQVNYVGKSIKTVPFAHEDSAGLSLLSRLMTFNFLHREIREKGGAYGGGATSSGGTFDFYSYRDPNSSRTIEAFDQAIEWACDGKFTDADIDEAKLGVFQMVDMPVAPGGKGQRQFLHNISDAQRHGYRLRLLDTDRQQLTRVAQRYLARDRQPSCVTLLGPKNKLSDDDNWKIVKAD